MQKKICRCVPEFYLFTIADHCPKALYTYIWLWKDKDEDNRVVISEKDAEVKYMISSTIFKNSLKAINKEGLLSYRDFSSKRLGPFNEYERIYEIELVGWDIDAEGYELC